MRVRVLPGLVGAAVSFAMLATPQGESPSIVGSQFSHTVQAGDTFVSIAARFGLETATLARMNGLKTNGGLAVGQTVEIDNRHIVPDALHDGILINVPQRMLFMFDQGRLAAVYPVGLGRPDWPTPAGAFVVALKEVDPVWDVPPSIQEEMRREGKKVITRMPPGPQNPLGRYWIGLSRQNLGIHGTIAPSSVYQFQSHGCIRLHPDDVAELFPRVAVGTPGEITYAPVLMTRAPNGAIYLEVHKDIYRRAGDLWTLVGQAAETLGVQTDIDWELAETVVRTREGLVRDISRRKAHRSGNR